MEFNWFHHLIPALQKYPEHVLTAGFCTAILAIICIIASALAGTPEAALIPSPKLSLRNLFEVIVESLMGLVDSVMGHGGQRFLPIVATIFLYISLNNVFGLFPGVSPATENFNTTFSVGAFVFVLYNYMGFSEHGLKYAKHFLGPTVVTMPKSNIVLKILAGVGTLVFAVFFLFIETISHAVRPLSLGLRLFGNMTGDHTVLSIFLNLVPLGVPVIFYALGLFVCFVQAFVFSLLTMVYLSMATAHDH